MKRFFTLIAGLLLVSSGAFAQENWKNIITNGNMEGEQDPMWSSFWCHDWRQDVEFAEGSNQKYDENSATEVSKGQFQGFAEIIEDPKKPGNHCARVVIRSKDEADAAGNPTTDTGNNKPDWTEWDSQFFIYATETIPEGKDVRLTFKVRGDKAGNLQTQAHYDPGNYNHYQLFGDIEYTTEWKEVKVEAQVTSDHTQENNGKAFQSVAFNLSTMRDGNVVYFDDIKLQVRDHKEEQQGEAQGYFNFLPQGTATEMSLKLANGEFTNFTAREGAVAPKGTGSYDHKAELVDDAVRGKVLTLQSIGYNAQYEKKTQVQDTDEEGNPAVDENGDPIMKEEIEFVDIYVRENGDTVKKNDGSVGVEDWATQFFASTPHKFKQGEKMKVHFFYRADKPATVQTQMHNGPGNYMHYQMLGDLNFTEEWQEYDQEVEIGSQQSGGTTIAFNCNVLKDVNNYYFDFIEISADLGAITVDDRTLQKTDIYAPVPAAEQEANVQIDLTDMVNTLGIEDLTAFLNDNTMKVLIREVIVPDDPEDDPEIKEGLSGELQATTGVYINNLGSYIDEEDGIVLTFPEEGIEGNTATLNIFNLTGEVKAGENINTTICFVKDGWFYTMNLTLVTPEDYEVINGVATVKADLNRKGTIYDLFGRKVTKARKGLYIKDGKKFFIK